MIYTDAIVVSIGLMDDYEGCICLKIDNTIISVHYQIPLKEARKYFIPGNVLAVDLWLFYGTAKKICLQNKQVPTNIAIAGGVLNGQVKEVYNSQEFRIDCGVFEIDLLNEEPLDILKDMYVQTEGTFHIFLPETKWSKENCWDD